MSLYCKCLQKEGLLRVIISGRHLDAARHLRSAQDKLINLKIEDARFENSGQPAVTLEKS